MKKGLLAIILILAILIIASGCTSQNPPKQTATPPVTTGVAASPTVQPAGNMTDIVSFVNDAVVYAQRVGKAAAIKEFANPNGSFTRGELYISALDFNGTNLAHPYHPEYAGVNQLNMTDIAGTPIIAAMRQAALNGSGFATYQFENPITGRIEQKTAYVKRVDDTWFVASGLYGSDPAGLSMSPDMIRQSLAARVGEAVAFAKMAGREKAVAAFNDEKGTYATNGSYIWANDMNGTTLAMPFDKSMIGHNQFNLTDPNGVRFIERSLDLVASGGGYFYYVYPDPATGKEEFKIAYVMPVDSSWVIGSGTYLPDIPAIYPKERKDQLVAQVNNAVAFVQQNGQEAAIRTFNDPNGTFSKKDMYVYAFDRNGTMLANPFLPGTVGVNRLSDRDPYGQYQVPYIIDNAEKGGGFMYYFFADPSTGYKIRLKLTYSKMAGDNLVVGAGIFT